MYAFLLAERIPLIHCLRSVCSGATVNPDSKAPDRLLLLVIAMAAGTTEKLNMKLKFCLIPQEV